MKPVADLNSGARLAAFWVLMHYDGVRRKQVSKKGLGGCCGCGLCRFGGIRAVCALERFSSGLKLELSECLDLGR